MHPLIPLLLMTSGTPAPVQSSEPAPGISHELAMARRRLLSDVEYSLTFDLGPHTEQVTGSATIAFSLANAKRDLVIDFDAPTAERLRLNGRELADSQWRKVNNHIVIAKSALKKGANQFAMRFTSQVAATGTPLTVYKDASDGAEYYYTLVVPSDAHRLFPCFDQPDLKGRVTLRLRTPADWQVVANGVESTQKQLPNHRVEHVFGTTKPISTYLMAFAAGPFAVVTDESGKKPNGVGAPMRMFMRKSKLERVERERLFAMHRASIDWCGRYFDIAYPFEKLDFVLCPGFPYGGMEHAGAIFYRESALVFDHDPTEQELMRRSTLIYHEVSHQWFGNLVTMRWFDDLWLKEGFATFIGYSILDELEPKKLAWLRFHQLVKQAAYRVDATEGTTPVFQELDNLANAKSNYGPIVYNKAPAVLHELRSALGPEVFRRGVSDFLKQHSFANATWFDLLAAFEHAGAKDAEQWSKWWILTAGMPRVRGRMDVEGGKLAKLTITQEAIQKPHDRAWPLTVPMLLLYADGTRKELSVAVGTSEVEVESLRGTKAPACVLLDHTDVAYGQFLLDERSRDYLIKNLPGVEDKLLRSLALTALFETVREAELEPEPFAKLVLRLLAGERDPLTRAQQTGALATTLNRYLDRDSSRELRRHTAKLLREQLTEGQVPGMALQTYRVLVRLCNDADTLGLLEAVLDGSRKIPGLALGTQDRFTTAAALLGAGRDGARERLDELTKASKGSDVAKYAYLAGAAAPTAEAKQRYFESYLDKTEPPEQWVQGSLANFHWLGQDELTLPYLRRALQQVEWVKEHRKIFFMPAWIDAFVNGHSSKQALDTVEEFLANNDLSSDIRRKLLYSIDGLRRAVRIRGQER